MTQQSALLALRGEKRREDVAAAVGISVSSLCAYENGTRNPSDTVKRKLAEYYGTTVGELFFGEKTSPSLATEGKNPTT